MQELIKINAAFHHWTKIKITLTVGWEVVESNLQKPWRQIWIAPLSVTHQLLQEYVQKQRRREMTNRNTQHFAAIFCRPVMWERASPFVWPFVHKPHDTGLLLKSSNSVHFDAEFPKPAVKIPLLPPKGMMKTFDSFVRHSARYSPAVHFGLLLAAHPSPSWP